MANVQSTKQRQTQAQKLKQKTKPQLVLEALLLEMSAEKMRERIDAEMMENPYLECQASGEEESYEAEARPSEAKTSNESAGIDNSDPDDEPQTENGYYEGPERQIAETETLFDHLMGQLNDYEMTPRQRELVTYLIGCVDSDGKLESTISQIADDLYIHRDMDVRDEELEEALSVLQQFDPPGIGGRSTRECLWIQAQQISSKEKREVFSALFSEANYDDFTHQKWNVLQQNNKWGSKEISLIKREIRHFDPYPGRSYGSAPSTDIIKPDFEASINDGRIELQLNDGDLPTVSINLEELNEDIDRAQRSKSTTSEKIYRGYAESGRMFIEAIKQRRTTLLNTMRAIVTIQRNFFMEGDEGLLKPMTLEDVAQRTGQDISTVSRVSKNKYIQTPYGTYPLKWFFTQKAKHESEDISIVKVKAALKELLEQEPKENPYSDDRLSAELKLMGYNVARRTVAKYRDQMGFPTASIRKRSI